MAIDPDKDVDGFHPCNVGKMVTSLACSSACNSRGNRRVAETL